MQVSIVNLLSYWLIVISGELASFADRLQRAGNPALPHKLLLWTGFYSAELPPFVDYSQGAVKLTPSTRSKIIWTNYLWLCYTAN